VKAKTQVLLVAAVAALALTAQEGRKAASAPVILHPEMAVQTGTYDKPAATLGVKPSEPWTATTIEAAVNKTPNAGKPVTVVGEILDLSCYLQLGKHGEAHRPCGQKCVRNGQPIGLLASDGTVYMLMPEEHHPRRDGGVDARETAAEHMGHIVEVSGTESMLNGYRAIFVQGLTK
jgi:hypothetical protein